ncbi:MAG TPA: hypothetical protein VLA75_09795, partial [Thermoanaerobaculia bacterium]|nr:hypothetical protein [Thermoanaerobaculia bacterium]
MLRLFLVLAALGALLWAPRLVTPELLADEVFYLPSFGLVAQGRSPYENPAFLYPPQLAVLGAWGIARFGTLPFFACLRLLEYLGIVAAATVALVRTPWSFRTRVLAGTALLWLSPAVASGLRLGNVVFAAVGGALLALHLWPRRPLAAGLLLGVSVALKPIAFAVVPLALAFRAAPQTARRARCLGLVAAGVFSVSLLAVLPQLGGLGSRALPEPAVTRSLTPHRLLFLLTGVSVPAPLLAAVVVGLFVLDGVRREHDPDELLLRAGIASPLALPLVWDHGLMLSLPVQLAALAQAAALPAEPAPGRIGRGPKVGLVAAALFAIHAGDGIGGVDDLPPLLQAPLLALPT